MGYSPWGHKESDRTERLHFHFSSQLEFLKLDMNKVDLFYLFLKCIMATRHSLTAGFPMAEQYELPAVQETQETWV